MVVAWLLYRRRHRVAVLAVTKGDAPHGDDRLQKEMERRAAADHRRHVAKHTLEVVEAVGKVVSRAAEAASLAGLPFAPVAAALVEHAVEAYKQVVANRAKCEALLGRMTLLQPAVEEIAGLLDGGKLESEARAEGARAVLTRIQARSRPPTTPVHSYKGVHASRYLLYERARRRATSWRRRR